MSPRISDPDAITFPKRNRNMGKWGQQMEAAIPSLIKGKAVSVDIDPKDNAKSAISSLYGHWHKRSCTRMYKRRLSIRKDTSGQIWMIASPLGAEEGGGDDASE